MKKLKNVLLVICGTLILAFGSAVFIIPFNLVVGGVTSVAIIIKNFVPSDFLTIDLIVFVLTWLLFFVGLVFLGRDFALKTLVSSIIYPFGISFFTFVSSQKVLNGFFNLNSGELSEISIILASVFGGVLIGVGCALTFIGGGSTGGMDILAFIICKINKKLRSSYVIFTLDLIVITLGVFSIKNFAVTLLGIVSIFISAMVVDKLFLGREAAFTAHIVSKNCEQIGADIISSLNRTATLIESEGAYSREKGKMLIVSFNLREYSDLLSLVSRIDKKAFVTIFRTHQINGEGWN